METVNGNLIGKRILVIFDDGNDRPSRKEGICTQNNSVEIVLDGKHLITKQRLLRLEVLR